MPATALQPAFTGCYNIEYSNVKELARTHRTCDI